MMPFDYPNRPRIRIHAPRGYESITSYRPWLRDEFSFRCIYCLRREVWEPESSVFEIDHVSPIVHSPELALEYTNLVYSCTVCNLAKRDRWIPDPLRIMTLEDVVIERDGRLIARSDSANALVSKLDLNDDNFITWRRMMIRIVELAAEFDPELHRALLALPDDLPNLAALRPPGGNAKPDGIAQSHFARRERGEPAVRP